jgi:hypothetical protein
MPFRNLAALAASADEGGKHWTSFIHKTGGPASFSANRWGDMSMGAGTPKYNAYVGTQFAATPLIGSGNDGIYAGPSPAPGETKHLHRMLLQSNSGTLIPATFMLCDYLMHYPLIDGDDTAQQDLDNTQTLPRYTDGAGVQMMGVITTPMAANAVMTVSYTNQDGVSGRISSSAALFGTVVGTVLSASNTSTAANSASPFLPLASGDSGVRSIESVTLSSGAGGFFALVLVKPIATVSLREAATANEVEQFRQMAREPEIKAGAYLNLIYCTAQAGTAVTLRGQFDFVWG